jgi:hypothetical protein
MSLANLARDMSELDLSRDVIAKQDYPKVNSIPQLQGTSTSLLGQTFTFRLPIYSPQWILPDKFLFYGYVEFQNSSAAKPILGNYLAPAPNFVSGMFNSERVKLNNITISEHNSQNPQSSTLKYRVKNSQEYARSLYFKDWGTGIPDFYDRQQFIMNGGVQTGKIRYTALTGTIVSSGTTLTGTSTAFDTELLIGDYIHAAGQIRRIATITSATIADTTVAFSPVLAAATGYRYDNYLAEVQSQNKIFFAYKPKLGFFDLNTPLPAGNYEFEFVSSPTAQLNAIQTISGGETAPLLIGHEFFMIPFIITDGEKLPKSPFNYWMETDEVNTQLHNITSANMNIQLNVEKSTYGFAIALQHVNAGSNNIYPPTVFKGEGLDEQTWTSIQIQYGNQTKISDKMLLTYDTNINKMLRGYAHTMMETNKITNTSGGEDFKTWLDLGPYFVLAFPHPRDTNYTSMTLEAIFSAAPTNANLLIMNFYKNVAKVSYDDEIVKNVEVDK